MRNAKLYYAAETLALIYMRSFKYYYFGEQSSFFVGNKRCYNRIKKMRLREARGYEVRPRRIFSTESKIERSIRLVYLAYQTCREKLVGENFRGEIFSNEIFNWTVTATTCDARFFLLFFFSLFLLLFLHYRFTLGKFYRWSFFKPGPSMGIMEADNGCMRTA